MGLFDSRFIVVLSAVFLFVAALFADGVNSMPVH